MLPVKIQSALIIDDETDICRLLQNYLKKKNIPAAFATSLSQGMDKFKEAIPSLLILDHNLKDGFGIDHIGDFRKLSPSIFVIIISAMSNLREKAFQNGADYFIEKPVSFKLLNQVLTHQPGE